MSFPDWPAVQNNVFLAYKDILKLEDDMRDHFNNQFRKFKATQEDGKILDPLKSTASFEKTRKNKINHKGQAEDKILDYAKNSPLDRNRFFLVGDSMAPHFIYVDESIQQVLGISPSEFTFERICAKDRSLNLFHPEDVQHIIRLGTLAFLVSSLKGVPINLFEDYYQAEFRILYDPETGLSRQVTRKSYLSEQIASDSGGRRYLDEWHIKAASKNIDPIKTDFHMASDDWANFVKILFYIINAKALGFSPEDVRRIAPLIEYKNLDDVVKDIKEKSGRVYQNRQLTHYKSRTLTNKVNSLLVEKFTLDGYDMRKVINRRLEYKCRQLGLYPVPAKLLDIIDTTSSSPDD